MVSSRSSIPVPSNRPANSGIHRRAVTIALVLALCSALVPLSTARAGLFWLPTRQASDASFDHLNPVLAAYHNHAYVLSVRVNGSSSVTSVFFSTDESGKWTTQLLSDQGPVNTYFGEFVTLAVDPTTGRLYAAWIYAKDSDNNAIAVRTRDPGGQWSAPVDAVVERDLAGQPSIVAQGGKSYLAFVSDQTTGDCSNPGRTFDVAVVVNGGGGWSQPRNLTSCVSDPAVTEFVSPKLAVDESGAVYAISYASGNLWFTGNASGTWSTPVQITQAASIPDSIGTSLRTFYGIAASNGVVYVTYLHQTGTAASDVVLLTRPAGASFSAAGQVSPADSNNCPKFGLSIAANAGRVAVSYIRGHTGYCKSSSGVFGNVPFLFTGGPGSLSSVGSLAGKDPDCFYSSLAKEGSLFRFVTACDHPTTIGKGQLYYKAELLDTIGPTSRLFAPARSAPPNIQLRWSATDPQPGSGVAYFELQARVDNGRAVTLLRSTRVLRYTYRAGRSGHHYIFRVRARDRAANWGAWVTAATTVR